MKTMWTLGLVAVVAAVTASASYGQQSGPPPAVDSTPKPATDYSIAAPGTTAQGPTQPEYAEEGGELSAGQPAGAAGSGLDRDAVGASATNRIQNDFPAPANRQRMTPGDAGMQREFGNGQGIANQRGELGVWLVPSGGPGVTIRRITEGSAAHQAGLQPGDVILQVNGQGATSPATVAEMVRDMPAGQVARVQYWRNGELQEVDVSLQPAREYRVGYRAPDNEMNEAFRSEASRPEQGGGDLEERMTRLERQLATVMDDLRVIRQQLQQSGGAATSAGGAGLNTTGAAATGYEAPSTPAAGAATTGAAATTEPSTVGEDNPFSDAAGAGASQPATTAPATEPAATPETLPAEDTAGADDDLFGAAATDDGTATEADAADTEAPATDDEAATEEAPAEDASDDLFQ